MGSRLFKKMWIRIGIYVIIDLLFLTLLFLLILPFITNICSVLFINKPFNLFAFKTIFPLFFNFVVNTNQWINGAILYGCVFYIVCLAYLNIHFYRVVFDEDKETFEFTVGILVSTIGVLVILLMVLWSFLNLVYYLKIVKPSLILIILTLIPGIDALTLFYWIPMLIIYGGNVIWLGVNLIWAVISVLGLLGVSYGIYEFFNKNGFDPFFHKKNDDNQINNENILANSDVITNNSEAIINAIGASSSNIVTNNDEVVINNEKNVKKELIESVQTIDNNLIKCQLCNNGWLEFKIKEGINLISCSNSDHCSFTKPLKEFIFNFFQKNGINIYKWKKDCWNCQKMIDIYTYFPSYQLKQAIKDFNFHFGGPDLLPTIDNYLKTIYDVINDHYSKKFDKTFIVNTCLYCQKAQGKYLTIEAPYEILDDIKNNKLDEKYLDQVIDSDTCPLTANEFDNYFDFKLNNIKL